MNGYIIAGVIIIAIGGIVGTLFIQHGSSISTKKQVDRISSELEDEKMKSALSGEIMPAISDSVPEKIRVFAGSFSLSTDRSHYSDGELIYPFRVLGVDYPLTLKLVEGRLMVSMKVYSLDGQTVAEINDNEWVVNPNNYFQRNYDENALEIIGEFDIPMQVELIDQGTIRVRGVFINSEGDAVIVDDVGVQVLKGRRSSEEIRDAAKNIKRIFEYPSDLNLGKRSNV